MWSILVIVLLALAALHVAWTAVLSYYVWRPEETNLYAKERPIVVAPRVEHKVPPRIPLDITPGDGVELVENHSFQKESLHVLSFTVETRKTKDVHVATARTARPPAVLSGLVGLGRDTSLAYVNPAGAIHVVRDPAAIEDLNATIRIAIYFSWHT